MYEDFLRYLNIVWFFVPLGVVGIWRWSIWLTKKLVAAFYRMPSGEILKATLAIITPVYNENPQIFKCALNSWKMNGSPDEIIAVIDFTDEACIEVFKSFARKNLSAKLIVTKLPGKRQALADGIRNASSEFVALVDSDTLWIDPIRDKLLAPFSDNLVGGVSPRQDIYQPNSLARKLFQLNLYNRYFVEMPFLGAVGDALTCLSGRTAVYRKSAVEDVLDRLVEEKFLGTPSVSGDDKTLTRLIQQAGWKAKYLREAVVYTPGFKRLTPFLQQIIRWSRNSWRSDLQTVFDGWVWKNHKVLGLYMLDRFLQPFTLLLSPVYLVVALSSGYWRFAVILIIWWLFSRSIKVFGHLKKHPRDILIITQYVIFTFVSALIKIYALITIMQQGWITRWDKSRMRKISLPLQSFAYAFTALIIFAYVGMIFTYRNESNQTQNFDNIAIKSVIATGPRELSNSRLVAMKQDILAGSVNDSNGIYAVKSGDFLLLLKNKFNLASIDFLKTADNEPIVNPNNISVGQKIAIPSKEMRNILNADELRKKSYRPAIIFYDSGLDTIFIKGSGSVVTPTIINKALGRNSSLQKTSDGEWLLKSNLYIGKNVTLVIDKQDTKYLKLKSDNEKFIWIRSQNGNILISDTKVTSWNEKTQQPDDEHIDGRSYITAKSSGRMDITNSEIGHLGYVGLPKRGGPFGGSYGLSWKITSGKFKDNLLTGSVMNSSIHDNYFGIYSFGATGILIKNNDVFHNVEYGIDPHDDSNNFLITENRTYENGNHGIILSKRCVNNEITNNISYNNKLHGIMLDRDSNNNYVIGNEVYGNIDGITVFESERNFIFENKIADNKQGIRLNGGSEFNYIEKNNIRNNETGMHVYGGSNNNVALNNSIVSNKIGLSIQNSNGNIFYGNFKPHDNEKDGHINVELIRNEIKL